MIFVYQKYIIHVDSYTYYKYVLHIHVFLAPSTLPCSRVVRTISLYLYLIYILNMGTKLSVSPKPEREHHSIHSSKQAADNKRKPTTMMIAFILLLFIHPAMSYTAISDLNFMTTKGNALQLFCTNQTLSESTYGPIENWNLKAVTNFAYMFSLQDSLGLPNNAARVQIITECCGRLKAADLSQWDVEGGLYLSFARPGPAFGLASEEFPFCEYRKPLCGEHWKKSKFLPDFNAYSSTNDLTLRPEYRQYFMDLFYCDGQLSNTNVSKRLGLLMDLN